MHTHTTRKSTRKSQIPTKPERIKVLGKEEKKVSVKQAKPDPRFG